MEFEKLVSPSLKDLFITHIEAMILSGELPVGQQLPPERQLAQSMGVSRAVVNSGVAELERRGFLEVRPRVGTFVTDYRRAGTLDTLKSIMTYNRGRLRNEEIRSILEIRDALDKLAAAGIIACASEEDIAALFRAAEAIREAGDNRHAAEAAFAFQHELAMQSGNTLLPLIFRSFYSSVLVLWERFCALNGVSMLYETSVRLCRHIRDRDLSAAVAWIDYCTRETVSGSRRIYYLSGSGKTNVTKRNHHPEGW